MLREVELDFGKWTERTGKDKFQVGTIAGQSLVCADTVYMDDDGYLYPDMFTKSQFEEFYGTVIEKETDMGEVSDGYHTFNQLYHQRAVLFAALVKLNKDRAWKSFKHSDGKYCFDENGEMFIVGIDTPEGSYTYHYHKKYWDMFDCQELEVGKEWDGHTEEDVTRLLSL